MPRLKYRKPGTPEHRAMMFRHKLAIAEIQAKPDMRDSDRFEWLLAVVAPGPELLAASLQAVEEKGQ